MKKSKSFQFLIHFYLIFILIIFSSSCKKETSEEPSIETGLVAGAEIDIKKIENLIGVKFIILKTESVGYIPLHKFYWCCLRERVDRQKVEQLASAIIKETIVRVPLSYHSFTIHFFLEGELEETFEKSECCARATFLPEGSWLKVGRVPIDDYKSYKLNCTFFK